jgi:signal transduction histidine kinase/ActR/RegA family two-component response regulator
MNDPVIEAPALARREATISPPNSTHKPDVGETQQMAGHLERLAEAISAGSSLEELCKRLLELGLDVAGAALGVIRVREGSTLRSRAAIGLDDEVTQGFSLPTLTAFAGFEPLEGAALHVSQNPQSAGWSKPMRDLALHAAYAVPMRAGENLLGMIYIGAVRALSFTAPQRRFLGLLGAHGGQALSRRQGMDQLEQAIRARDDLLAVVAHDLRNPLNVITVSGNSLMRRQPDPSMLRPIERIMRATQRADRLIRDLLDVNAIESGRFAVERKQLELADVLLAALESQQSVAADASVILTSDISADLPHIEADEERILEVLENLISNAVKFTEPGGVVTIGASSGGGEVMVWVKDNGHGIRPDHLPKLFDRFWQARRHDRRGTGLGLTICKAIVEAHGGRIWAESALGAGTTMQFSLPVTKGEAAMATPQPVSNILLVDDRPENLVALKSILQNPNYRLVTASNGEEALRLALREQFDVALIDVAMPGMDGVEVAGHMRALERCRDIPILFVTAFGNDPQEIHRAYAAGGADYLVKPLDAEIVRKKVAVFASLRRRREAESSR